MTGIGNNEDLHREFRSLIMLVTLVTAINNSGEPTSRNYYEPCNEVVLEKDLPSRHRVLNAAAALLVRNTEVLAVAACDPPPHQPFPSAHDANNNTASSPVQNYSYHLWAIQQDPKQVNYIYPTTNKLDRKDDEDCSPRFDDNDRRFSDITAVTKPDLQDEYIELVNNGKSHMSSVNFNDWGSLFTIPNNDPLENHAATLEDYFRQYKSLPKERRMTYFAFTRYIVSRSWKKMHRRFFHWCSLGFMMFLTRVSEQQFRLSFKCRSSFLPTSTRNDAVLGGLLVGMQEKGQIESVVMSQCSSSNFRSELPHLLAAFAEVLEKKERKRVYSEATCYEFHQLLVVALIAYGNALSAFGEVERKLNLEKMGKAKAGQDEHKPTSAKSDDTDSKPVLADSQGAVDLEGLMKTREECAEQLWKCCYLLWRIADSQILSDHLTVLGSLCLHMPDGKHRKSLYVEELKFFTGLTGALNKDRGDGEDGEVEGKDVDTDEEDEDMDEEFGVKPETYVRNRDLALVYKRWIHLQVSHWMALDVLSSFSHGTAAQSVKIHLLTMKHLKRTNDSYEMESWETTIKKLAAQATQAPGLPQQSWIGDRSFYRSSIPFDAETTIIFLKKKIDHYAKVEQSNAIFRAFKPKEDHPDLYAPEFYGGVHCEVALASLAKYTNEAMDKTTEPGIFLEEIIRNSNHNVIAMPMSKLCCPVCRELLDILQGETTDFDVHGYHRTVSPMQLPLWLPHNTMEQIVARFKNILYREIAVMMQARQRY
ncbi:hypothetical protein PILCRDRAFT_369556 [Piloderma croceum F 1598]|uniref:Uncharacterized protein n=1 Tax=Piloderma croceum (strain F 1598) TaxID=765440 RepID=A0A0C3BEQ5_PILCF|nr:hypothetical protein PILCRDRAFT_369556 [Piloderma croceum F 1598]